MAKSCGSCICCSWDQQSEIRRSKRYCSCVSRTYFPSVRIFPLRDLAASASTAGSLSENLGDPPIIRSIMSTGGGGRSLGTLDCKQQIDELICHLVWKETGFSEGGGEGAGFTFPIQMNQSISALSWDAPPPRGVECVCGAECGKKKDLVLVFLHSFCSPQPPNHPSSFKRLCRRTFVASKVSPSWCLPPVVL